MLFLLLVSLASANFGETYQYTNTACTGGIVAITGSVSACTLSGPGACTNRAKSACVATPSPTPANMTFVLRLHGADTTCTASLQGYTFATMGQCLPSGSSASNLFTCANGVQTWTMYGTTGCTGSGLDIVNTVGCSQCSTTPQICFAACGSTATTSATSASTISTATTGISTTKPSTAQRVIASFILISLAFLL